MKAITNNVLMIRPARFGFNPETAQNNTFQRPPSEDKTKEIRWQAITEFDNLVAALQNAGVNVVVAEDTEMPNKPDAVFPNNWISFHEDGSLITYPMYAPLRRNERREDIIAMIEEKYLVKKRYSFEQYEAKDLFLEGTGSMVLDRVNKLCYACLSERTDVSLLNKFCLLKQYEMIKFKASDANGVPIYHTNVMMALGRKFAVLCLEAIESEEDRLAVTNNLKRTQKEIIEITRAQMNAFAGNMLQLASLDGDSVIVMSSRAYENLKNDQIEKLKRYSRIVHSDISTIEDHGGGSARCMIAEIFLPLSTI